MDFFEHYSVSCASCPKNHESDFREYAVLYILYSTSSIFKLQVEHCRKAVVFGYAFRLYPSPFSHPGISGHIFTLPSTWEPEAGTLKPSQATKNYRPGAYFGRRQTARRPCRLLWSCGCCAGVLRLRSKPRSRPRVWIHRSRDENSLANTEGKTQAQRTGSCTRSRGLPCSLFRRLAGSMLGSWSYA